MIQNILVLFIAVCGTQTFAFDNIVDTLSSANATTLLQLIQQAGLTDTLKTGGPFTILAPTNDAFAKVPQADLQTLKADTQTLSDVLLYHVINGELFEFDLRTGEHFNTTNGHTLRVYTGSTGNVYFNQGKVIKGEIQASNGVIYLIDEVLDVPEGSIMDIINNPAYNLTSFAYLLHRSGLDRSLGVTSSTARYTVFAPSESAFDALPASLKTRLLSTSTYARYISQYHIHRGTLHLKSFDQDGHITTMYSGHLISLTHDSNSGEAVLNTLAHFTITDIEADNGVVHVISHVLIPSTLSSIVG